MTYENGPDARLSRHMRPVCLWPDRYTSVSEWGNAFFFFSFLSPRFSFFTKISTLSRFNESLGDWMRIPSSWFIRYKTLIVATNERMRYEGNIIFGIGELLALVGLIRLFRSLIFIIPYFPFFLILERLWSQYYMTWVLCIFRFLTFFSWIPLRHRRFSLSLSLLSLALSLSLSLFSFSVFLHNFPFTLVYWTCLDSLSDHSFYVAKSSRW